MEQLILVLLTIISFVVAFTIASGSLFAGASFWLPLLSLTTMRSQKKLARLAIRQAMLHEMLDSNPKILLEQMDKYSPFRESYGLSKELWTIEKEIAVTMILTGNTQKYLNF